MRAKAKPAPPLSRSGRIRFLAGVVVLTLLAAAAAWMTSRSYDWETTASGLRYRVVQAGEGPNVGPEDEVLVTYTGRLTDGTIFDSNADRQPTPMSVGGVVPGFGEALQLMNRGATYRVRIPPELGYGAEAPPGGPIPPNATLDFEITLVDLRTPSAEEVQQRREMEMMRRQQIEEMQRQSQQGGEAAPGGGAPRGGAEPRGPGGR
jgi:FKBP-type peptidyl-prolyl cis-trans isomerase FkpA